MKHNKGSALAIVTIVLAVALAASLGYILWQALSSKPSSSSVTNTTNLTNTTQQPSGQSSSQTTTKPNGTIAGSITYPSEMIPDAVEVHALNIDTGSDYYTKDHIKNSRFTYGVGYSISVPEGRYYVYALEPSRGTKESDRAYYDKFMTCGMMASCKDTSKLEVSVTSDKETFDITVGDWWNSGK